MEERKIFDKKFVHFMWSDGLEGAEGFVDDNIDTLVARVNGNIRETVDKIRIFGPVCYGTNTYPFSLGSTHYKFFYYDPLYEIKWAWKQGKQIQARSKGSTRNEWANMEHPGWLDGLDCLEYRVKPEEKTWRPFKDIQELKNVWSDKDGLCASHREPMIWVRDKERPDITRLITDFNAGCKAVALAGQWHGLKQLFDDYTFLDGTPCGVEE